MASRNDGIQLLLQAEKKAADKVAEAKRREFTYFLIDILSLFHQLW